MQMKWLFVILILTTISIDKLNSQTNIDTLNLSDTFLEERHLRYMYNFALNGLFFQYKSNIGSRIVFENQEENTQIGVIPAFKAIRDKDIRLFTGLDTIKSGKYVQPTEMSINKLNFITQSEIVFLTEFQDYSSMKNLSTTLIENPKMNYAAQFSNVFIYEDKIYLSVILYLHINLNPNNLSSELQMYEFQYCKSTNWVYPKRVSNPFFRHFTFEQGHIGGTIQISNLECY